MSIVLYIVLFLIILAIGWVLVFLLDFLLAKVAFKMVIGKVQGKLDAEKLKEEFHRLMENRRQKWAFKAYLGTVAAIISAGGILSFIRADLFVANSNGIVDMKLFIDNEVSPWVLVTALLCTTLVYFLYLYYSNKRYKADVLSAAAVVINEQYIFSPTQDWFKTKSELSIKNLGKSFDLTINFRYELFEDAFVSTCRDERMAQLFQEERKQLLSDFNRKKNSLGKDIGEVAIKDVEAEILCVVDNLSLRYFDSKAIETVEKSIDKIDSIFRDAIRKDKLKYDDYDYTSIHSALGKIRDHVENPWIQSINGQSLIVYGEGGFGKTHLLAKLVQRRIEEKLPTIFFLGRVITDANIPMDQILNTLDIKCKKETFFKALDAYGKKHGRVLLIVDGINEGAGLSLWKNHLLNFLNEFSYYPNIGVIVSVRTTGGTNWFDKFIREEGFPSYEHRGFEDNVSGAVEYMFKSFSVPLPTWPILNQEFRNPMLLTLFCRAHQGDATPPKHETRLEIIEHYIAHFNERLSNFFQYSSSTSVLQTILYEVAAKMIANGSRWRLEQTDLMTILSQNETIGGEASRFLDAMVDEGLLNEYDLSPDNHFYTFGYDNIGSYLIADTMVNHNTIKGPLLQDGSVLEALTDVLPNRKGKELFEILADEETGYFMKGIFVQGLPMRNKLTKAGEEYLKGLYEEKRLSELFEIIASVPYHKDWPLNAGVLDDILKPMRLVERDVVWTVNISGYTETKAKIGAYVSWAWSASPDVVRELEKETLQLIVRLLIWTLATTDLALRDRTTRALVNLMRNDEGCLLKTIKDYHDVNDNYIVERLMAVTFGCCTGNQNPTFVGHVAQAVYECIFKDGNPTEDILVRDFSKCIIDYAVSLNCNIDIDYKFVAPPYSKTPKNVFVPTDEIMKYELDFEKTGDRDLYWAQTNIMESMRTEYSSRGLYGDFGRYTFQSLLDNWEESIEQISNYAIKFIFEDLGYDAKIFKTFDGQYASRNRHKNTVERIGKKYQWIALYKIAAILADNHFGEPMDRDWRSPMNINARNFDPTLFMNPDTRDFTESIPAYRVPKYDLTQYDDEKWMRAWKLMPDVKDYIEYEHGGQKWIALYTYYSITSNSQYDIKQMMGKSERDLWTFVQAFMVDKKDRKKLCKTIYKEGMEGRSISENREVYSIYYREYYWADSYKKEVEDAGYTNREFEVGRVYTGIMVQPAYLLYSISEYSDASLAESKEVEMPSPYLYRYLGLNFSANEGVWLASDGSVACYDSHWVHGGHGCLLFRKDLLLDYMRRNKKCLVWPILMERTYKPMPTFWPRIQAGGYICMDEKGRLVSKFRSYEEKKIDKIRKRLVADLGWRWDQGRMYLHQHRIWKLEPEDLFRIMTKESERKRIKRLMERTESFR